MTAQDFVFALAAVELLCYFLVVFGVFFGVFFVFFVFGCVCLGVLFDKTWTKYSQDFACFVDMFGACWGFHMSLEDLEICWELF